MRTDRLRRRYAIRPVHVQFPLHPETPAEGRRLEELFAGRDVDVEAMQERLQRLMDDAGLPYGERTHTYNSRRAQELAKWAVERPGGEAVHDALFRAYFAEGENIADPDVLMEVVESLDLPADEARDALRSGAYADAVDDDWARSRALGIRGVPTYVADGRGVVGAQPYEVLERLVVEAGAERR